MDFHEEGYRGVKKMHGILELVEDNQLLWESAISPTDRMIQVVHIKV
jgi:hypothetical protein